MAIDLGHAIGTGAYVTVAVVALTVAVTYGRVLLRSRAWDEVRHLQAGIFLAFAGHGIDQSWWAVNRALGTIAPASDLWWLFSAAKGLAIAGGLVHLSAAVRARTGHYRTVWIFGVAVALWLSVAAAELLGLI